MNQPSKPVLFVVAMFFSLGAFGVWQVVRGGDRSSDPTLGLEQKLDEAESALTKLRDQVATYETLATRTAALEERLDAMDARPVALSLAAYPIPDEVVFCGERIPLEIPEIHRRYEDEWNRFLVNRHWLISWMRRAREAYPIVEAKLVAAGLPTDLKYVMTIESAIDARATSSAGAVGYWQFIQGTGKRYGLRRTSTLDERRDLARATDAAIEYFTKLYDEFGSWPVALAAYNSGENRLRKSIEAQASDSFYDLNLPQETEAYWFKAAAVKPLFEHPERYGFLLEDDGWAPVACDTLDIEIRSSRVEVRDIAQAAGLSYREFKRFNPWYRREYINKGHAKLVVPTQSVSGVMKRFPNAKLVGRAADLGNRAYTREDAVDSDGSASPMASSPTEPKR